MNWVRLLMTLVTAVNISGISAAGRGHILSFDRGKCDPGWNKFQLKGLYCDNSNEHYLDETYWLAPSGYTGWGFIAKLDSSGPWKGIKLRNTHNGHTKRDKSTGNFTLYLGSTPNGPWNQILRRHQLADSRQQDPPPLQEINFPSGSKIGEYLRFDVDGYYGGGARLQYIDMIPAKKGRCGSHIVSFVSGSGSEFPNSKNKFQWEGMQCDNSNEIHEDGTYWLTTDSYTNTGFIAELDSNGPWKGIKLRNTHHGHLKDRGMKEFSLYLGPKQNGDWIQCLDHKKLEDSSKQNFQPLLNITFPSQKYGNYLKLYVDKYWGNGAGLQYLNMIPA